MSKSCLIIVTLKVLTFSIVSFSLGQYKYLESNITNDLFDVCFYDSLKGWAVGDSATIITTNDGGMTWARQIDPADSTIFTKVEFVNRTLGFVGGNRIYPNPNEWFEYPILFKTTDGGDTWEELDLGLTHGPEDEDISLRDMDFLDSNRGWVAVNAMNMRIGMLLSTDNGGESWTPINEISQNLIFTTTIWDKKIGYILYGPAFDNFNQSRGAYTVDNGSTWISTGSISSSYMRKMIFISEDTLWAIGAGIYKSHNRGENWITIGPTLEDKRFYPRDIHDFNSQNVWLVGYVREKTNLSDYSAILMTTQDAGENWKVNLEIPQKYFYACDIISPQHICIVGDKGLIIFVSLSEITSIENSETNPSSFELKQNYPNPFNPKTHITFQLNKPGEAELNIYNIQGQLIENLLKGYKSAGKHSILFDGTNYPSGLYFYRLKTSNFIDAKKMIIIK